MASIDLGDPLWEDHRTAAQRWQDEWSLRAADHPLAATQGFVVTHTQSGLSRAEIRTLVRRGLWSAPRRGIVSPVHPHGDPLVGATLAATATALARRAAVVSHESAAILHRLPTFSVPIFPQLTAPGRNGSRSSVGIHLTSIGRAEREVWFGVPVTTAARTVVDVARGSGPIAGLVTADAALREDLCTVDELTAAIVDGAGRPGNAAARWVAKQANALSESALESLTRARLLQAGLPEPELQVTIPGTGARVDLLYRHARLVIEADGMLKYTEVGVLRAEKLRQERLERAGYRVIRILWSDVIGDASATLVRINRALRS